MRWWLRAYLLFAAAQGLTIGLTGFVAPSEIQIPLSISPLNAGFVGALYVAGAIGVLVSMFAQRRSEVRLFVISFGVATTLILILTLARWADFMSDQLPHRETWLFNYGADVILTLVVLPAAGLLSAGPSTRHPLTAVFMVESVIFGALGAFLLILPEMAASRWPWSLPPVLGQLYGCFFLAVAVGAALTAREGEPRARSTFTLTTFVLMVLVLVASVLHLDRFEPQPLTSAWFAAFGIGAIVFGLALVWDSLGRRHSRAAALRIRG